MSSKFKYKIMRNPFFLKESDFELQMLSRNSDLIPKHLSITIIQSNNPRILTHQNSDGFYMILTAKSQIPQ